MIKLYFFKGGLSMKKVLLMLSFLLVNATVFADDVTLSLEKLYEQQDTITTTQEITSQDIEKVNPAQAMEVLKMFPVYLFKKQVIPEERILP